MEHNRELKLIVEKAIPLPECPVKKQDAVIRRVWLMREIERYCERQIKPNIGPTEYK